MLRAAGVCISLPERSKRRLLRRARYGSRFSGTQPKRRASSCACMPTTAQRNYPAVRQSAPLRAWQSTRCGSGTSVTPAVASPGVSAKSKSGKPETPTACTRTTGRLRNRQVTRARRAQRPTRRPQDSRPHPTRLPLQTASVRSQIRATATSTASWMSTYRTAHQRTRPGSRWSCGRTLGFSSRATRTTWSHTGETGY